MGTIGRIIKRYLLTEEVSSEAVMAKPKARKENNDFTRNRDIMKLGKG